MPFDVNGNILTSLQIKNYNEKGIVRNGLVLYLDAGIVNSYPGSGTTIYDLSGGGRDFTLNNGVSYSTINGGALYFDGTNDFLSGPASNAFSLGQEHTIEVIIKSTAAAYTNLFNWRDSAGSRTIMAHAPWINNYVYYDVGGCCGPTQRLNYLSNLPNNMTHMVFRCRTSTTPYRQVFENTVEKINSGTDATATLNFGTLPAVIGAYDTSATNPWIGYLYTFRLYNRALTDAELLQNYNANRRRVGL